MKAADLKEAEQIVLSLANFQSFRRLGFDTVSPFGNVRVVPPNFDPRRNSATDLALTLAAGQAALKVMREGWDLREAELRRRAAQIGLSL